MCYTTQPQLCPHSSTIFCLRQQQTPEPHQASENSPHPSPTPLPLPHPTNPDPAKNCPSYTLKAILWCTDCMYGPAVTLWILRATPWTPYLNVNLPAPPGYYLWEGQLLEEVEFSDPEPLRAQDLEWAPSEELGDEEKEILRALERNRRGEREEDGRDREGDEVERDEVEVDDAALEEDPGYGDHEVASSGNVDNRKKQEVQMAEHPWTKVEGVQDSGDGGYRDGPDRNTTNRTPAGTKAADRNAANGNTTNSTPASRKATSRKATNRNATNSKPASRKATGRKATNKKVTGENAADGKAAGGEKESGTKRK
ncbi:hypothetical protein ACMFMG_001572 [Clarireedia jacksonii]